MGNKLIAILALVFLIASAKGQVKVQGTIYDKSERIPLHSVSVLTTSGAGSQTDSLGHYSIILDLGDSLYFSWLGKETARFAAKDIPTDLPFDMSLEVSIQSLPSISVSRRQSDYYLDSLENRKEYQKVFEYSGSSDLSDMKMKQRGGLGIGLDLNSLLRPQQERRMSVLHDRLELEEKDKYIDHRFTKNLVKKITRMQSPALDSFMLRERPDYELLKRFETDYEYYQYIEVQAKYFEEEWIQKYPGMIPCILLVYRH
jgi:hypothetical protein